MSSNKDNIHVEKILGKLPFPLSDLTKIEYNYIYAGKSSSRKLTFYGKNAKSELNSLRDKHKQAISIAKHLGFNKMIFSILDGSHISPSCVGIDKIIFEKPEINSPDEFVFNPPGIHRVISPLGKDIVSVCIFIFFFIISSISAPITLLAGLLEKIGIFIFAGSLFTILWFCALYWLIDYFRYQSGHKKELDTFGVKQLTSRDYPLIVVNKENLIYECQSNRYVIPWANINSLVWSHGKTIIQAYDGNKYPIPTYNLISIFSNEILVLKIIDRAKLKKIGQNDYVR